MTNKTVEQKTTTTFTPEPRRLGVGFPERRQVSISVHTEPTMKPRIIVSVPSHGRRDGGTATLQLRGADDLKDLAEIAAEAYREMTKDTTMPTGNWIPATERVREVFASDEFGELKDHWAEEFDRWHQAELRRAKTISAEQVDAARDSILYDKNRGIEIAIHSPGFDGKSLNDAATELATLAFRAAGLLIEGEE